MFRYVCLRLGWYPRHRAHGRPASIEHLDRLAPGRGRPQPPGAPWDLRGVAMGPGDPRKPLTLPPNLSPKFFHRSPREALRRVTSLLIRKGKIHHEPLNNKKKSNLMIELLP